MGDSYIPRRLLNFNQTKILISSGCQGFWLTLLLYQSSLLRPVSTSLIFRLSLARTVQNQYLGPVRAVICIGSNLFLLSTAYCLCSWPNTPEWGRFRLTWLAPPFSMRIIIYVNRRQFCAVPSLRCLPDMPFQISIPRQRLFRKIRRENSCP